MSKVKDMSIEDIEQLIKNKILRIFGDPEAGLQLSDEFKKKLKARLKEPSKRVFHKEVLKRLG